MIQLFLYPMIDLVTFNKNFVVLATTSVIPSLEK